MQSIQTATRRFSKSQSYRYLSKGNRRGTVNKNGVNTSRRRLDKAIIEEGNRAPLPPKSAAPTYRVVVSTQVYENYGYHWKAKGGEDYILAENLDETTALMADVLDYIPAGIEHRSEHYEEFIIFAGFIPSNQPTSTETMVADLLKSGYIGQTDADQWLARTRKFMQ